MINFKKQNNKIEGEFFGISTRKGGTFKITRCWRLAWRSLVAQLWTLCLWGSWNSYSITDHRPSGLVIFGECAHVCCLWFAAQPVLMDQNKVYNPQFLQSWKGVLNVAGSVFRQDSNEWVLDLQDFDVGGFRFLMKKGNDQYDCKQHDTRIALFLLSIPTVATGQLVRIPCPYMFDCTHFLQRPLRWLKETLCFFSP